MDRDPKEDLISQLEWVEMENELARARAEEETKVERFIRKFKENPLVPTGVLATGACISYGVYNMYTGDSKMQQLMMRYRVGFQFFTICAFIGGIYLGTGRSSALNMNALDMTLKSGKDT